MAKVELKAPPRKFRVVGVDTFEAPDADYLVGDYPDLSTAVSVANVEGGVMNPCYVYDQDAHLRHQHGSS